MGPPNFAKHSHRGPGRRVRRPGRLVLATAVVATASLAAAGSGSADPVPVLQTDAAPILVVDTRDGAIDPGEQAAALELAAAARSGADRTAVPQGLAANTGTDIAVSYPEGPPPADVRAVIDRAVRTWNATLVTEVAVIVDVYWYRFNNNNLLGFAGPTQFIRNRSSNRNELTLQTAGLEEALPTGGLYPIGLVNQYLGFDANGATAELEIHLNADLYGSVWNLTPDPPGFGELDFETVVLHELGHGLGFTGGATNGTISTSSPWVYDEHVYHGATPLLSTGNPNSHLTGGELFFQLRGGERYELWAPPTWQAGSSFSHLDENVYGPGTPGALMTPSGDAGETNRVIDSPTRSIFADIGWIIETPIAGSVAAASTLDEIRAAYDYGANDADTMRLYQAFLDRVPDAPGAVYWIGQTDNGANLDDLAFGFAQSVEFRQRYGTLSNADFLTLLYDNMLDRIPDQAGFDYWLGQMNDGLSQDGVVRWIVANAEFEQRYPWEPLPVTTNPGDEVNCGDFATNAAAREWFDHFRQFGDIGALDPDGNGVACEVAFG